MKQWMHWWRLKGMTHWQDIIHQAHFILSSSSPWAHPGSWLESQGWMIQGKKQQAQVLSVHHQWGSRWGWQWRMMMRGGPVAAVCSQHWCSWAPEWSTGYLAGSLSSTGRLVSNLICVSHWIISKLNHFRLSNKWDTITAQNKVPHKRSVHCSHPVRWVCNYFSSCLLFLSLTGPELAVLLHFVLE